MAGLEIGMDAQAEARQISRSRSRDSVSRLSPRDSEMEHAKTLKGCSGGLHLPVLLGHCGGRRAKYEKLQDSQLPESWENLDMFAGRELRVLRYDGMGGHVAAQGTASSLHQSFTCIMRVKPDFSKENEMPLVFCATVPYAYNKLFHLTLRDRRPYFGFGWNNLAADVEIPENEWSWLAFVFDSCKGRRILIDGRVVKADRKREPFCGDGEIEIGHWFAGSFKGELANLVLLQDALSDGEIRSVLADSGFDVSCSAWMSGRCVDCELGARETVQVVKDTLGAGCLRRLMAFFNRLSQFADVLSDIVVAIDNATKWKDLFGVIHLSEHRQGYWACINLMLIAAPFIAEYLLMFRTGVVSLTRLGVPFPTCLYCIFGLPTMVLMKVWLLIVNPVGHTPLTFLGAFDSIDLIAQAVFETPWQAIFSAYCFLQTVVDGNRSSGFPTTICVAFIFSLLALCNSILVIRARQSVENASRHDLRTGWSELDSAELSFAGTVCLVLKAGMGTTFSAIPGEALNGGLDEVLWALQPPSTLETLILEDNHLQECSRLAEALRDNWTLLHLDLSLNHIRDWVPLTQSLTVNHALKFLCLKSNHIVDLTQFADMLKVNKVLESLVLAWNQIEDVSSIALALCDNHSLLRLNLAGNKIQDVTPFVETLKSNTTMRHLNLSSNHIQMVSTLTEALKLNATLELFCLGGNPIEDMYDFGPFGHVVF